MRISCRRRSGTGPHRHRTTPDARVALPVRGRGRTTGSRCGATTGTGGLRLCRRFQDGFTHRGAQRGGQRLRFLAGGVRGQCAASLQALQRLVGDAETGNGQHAIGDKVVRIALQHFFGGHDGTRVITLIELQLRDAHPRFLAGRIGTRGSFKTRDRRFGTRRGHLRFGGRHRRVEGRHHRLLRRRCACRQTRQQNQCQHRPIDGLPLFLHFHANPS